MMSPNCRGPKVLYESVQKLLIICCLGGSSVPLEVKVAEDHGKQKAAFYAGFSVSQQEVEVTYND